ncbi:MAG: heparinase II/III family protein, partial [Phycisphaerae bacterium]
QMIKGPRFLWLRWTKATCRRWFTRPDLDLDYFRGAHFGYTRLAERVVHERTVLRLRDTFAVLDEITGRGTHDVALRWRLCDTSWRQTENNFRAEIDGNEYAVDIASTAPVASRIARGEEKPNVEGWESRYYAVKTPAPTILAPTSATLPLRYVTVFGPAVERDRSIALLPDSATLRVHEFTPQLSTFIAQLADWRIAANSAVVPL